MAEVMDKPAESDCRATRRRFSPNRILARSFRLSRDKWKQKHHQVQAKLEEARQLAAERGIARDHWRERCDQATVRARAAEARAAQLQGELEEALARIAALEAASPKKNALTPLDLGQSDPPARGSTPLSIINVCRQLGQTKASIQQTSDAHLLGPSLRPKARYMNLAPLLKWSRRVLDLLDRGAAGGVASARAEARYGWLSEYRAAIEEWARCEATVRRSVEFFRTRGVYVGCTEDLAAELSSRAVNEHDGSLTEAWLDYARTSSVSVRPGERLVASTEVIESLFGKWKSLERQASRSGITSYVLSLGALVGCWPLSRIKTALEAIPVKHVVAWIAEHLPTTVQSQRRTAFATP